MDERVEQRVLLAGEGRLADELEHLIVAGDVELVRWPGEVTEAEGITVAIDAGVGTSNGKAEAIRALEGLIAEEAVLLTACLAASATEIAAGALHSERIVGFAVLPPLDEDILVELARGTHTSAGALAAAARFVESLGWEAVEVGDQAGLVLPRIVCCLVNEAASALGEGVADAKAIDTAMRLGMNQPRGPLLWGDLIGLDVVYAVVDGLRRAYREDRYRPAPLLRRKVLAGELGVASGQGFYEWSG